MAESTHIDRCEFDRTMQERYCFNCDRIKETHYPIFGVACKTCWVMDMLDEIENFPAADVRPVVRGEWKHINNRCDGYAWQICSECGEKGKSTWNFCRNCGADMRGDNNAE